MKLEELKRTIDRYIDAGHGEDVILITLNDPSVGARASAGILSIHPGFDWESGQLRIGPDKKIVSYDKDRDIIIEPWVETQEYNGKKFTIRNCRKCGSKVRKDDRYCSCCGQRLR